MWGSSGSSSSRSSRARGSVLNSVFVGLFFGVSAAALTGGGSRSAARLYGQDSLFLLDVRSDEIVEEKECLGIRRDVDVVVKVCQ